MLWVCLNCSTAYAPAPACPHCGSTEYAEAGTEQAKMAKITRHGGASYEGQPAVEELPAEVTEEPAEEEAAAVHPYEGWLLTQLQDECVRRELSKSGNKAELVARLLESDYEAAALEAEALEEAPAEEVPEES